jgi:hypothetical protein
MVSLNDHLFFSGLSASCFGDRGSLSSSKRCGFSYIEIAAFTSDAGLIKKMD